MLADVDATAKGIRTRRTQTSREYYLLMEIHFTDNFRTLQRVPTVENGMSLRVGAALSELVKKYYQTDDR